MKIKSLASGILIFLFLTLGCNSDQNEQLIYQQFFINGNAIDSFTSKPDPLATGPYEVCELDYDFSPDRSQWWMGRIYIPVIDSEQCLSINNAENTALNRKFNLVIIAHADGQGTSISEAHLNYAGLASHLASNAMIVVSINRYASQQIGGASDIFDQVLTHHINYLYDESAIRNVINDNIAIIGHSAGGRSVIRHGDVIEETGKNLRSTILLAPTVNLLEEISFAEDTQSFLGIQVTDDDDANAFGSPIIGIPMQTSFKVYDEIPLSASDCREKDLLFVDHSGHYFQNEDFSLGYINAYLQLHLNGHNIFERFFKYQEFPPGLNTIGHWKLHDEFEKLEIENFEDPPTNTTTAGGPLDFSTGFTNRLIESTYLNDAFSPHSTYALSFDVISNQVAQMTLSASDPLDLSSYPFIGFRMGQLFDPETNSSGNLINVRLRLNTEQVSSEWVEIQNHGGLLHFPMVTSAAGIVNPPANLSNGGTKNAMRSYLIRRTEFAGIDPSAVESVTFEFESDEDGLKLVIDDIAFYRF